MGLTIKYYQQKSPVLGSEHGNDFIYGGDLDYPITFLLKKNGQVSELNGIDGIFNNAVEKLTVDKFGPNMFDYNYFAVKNRFSENYYEYFISQFFPVFPDSTSRASDVVQKIQFRLSK